MRRWRMAGVRREFWRRSREWRSGQLEAGQCRRPWPTGIQGLGTQRFQRCRHARSGNCEGSQVGRRISRATRGEKISFGFGERWREVGRDLAGERVCGVQRPVSTTRESPRRGRRIQEGRIDRSLGIATKRGVCQDPLRYLTRGGCGGGGW